MSKNTVSFKRRLALFGLVAAFGLTYAVVAAFGGWTEDNRQSLWTALLLIVVAGVVYERWKSKRNNDAGGTG